MTQTNPFGPDFDRYWQQRYQLFSRFDEGIRIDKEGLFSATPEEIAMDQAQRIQCATVLDGFCGVGSNAIAFARLGKQVHAVDTHPERLEMARHNASIYGVESDITFSHTDVAEALTNTQAAAVFLDPPWGGTAYRDKERFTLTDFGVDMDRILRLAFEHADEVMFKAPLNLNAGEELKKYEKQFSVTYSVTIEELNGAPLFQTIHFTTL